MCSSPDDIIASCAFYETSGNDWVDTELLFTGHSKGFANVSRLLQPLSISNI